MSIDQLNHHEFRASHGAFRTWHVGGLVAVVVCDVADGLSLHSSSDFLICDQVSAAAEGPWSDPREPDLRSPDTSRRDCALALTGTTEAIKIASAVATTIHSRFIF